MPSYSQEGRPLNLSTPLGADALLLLGFEGHEAISEPFRFHIDAVTDRQHPVSFDQLLGQPVLVEHWADAERHGPPRCFHGIVSRIGELGSDDAFTSYRLEVVPALWLLSLNVQCRIFQQQTVPDILREVLRGQEVAFRLQGTYLPHNYCVQYGESDYHFASRLMEEEGIHYYFEHSQAGHRLVLADRSANNPELLHQPRAKFDPAVAGPDERVERWQKFQELRPGRYTVWDYSFELPSHHLDATASADHATQAGRVVHDLGLGRRRQLEVFEYPGAYGHRFDSVETNGQSTNQSLQAVFDQNIQTAELRMQEQLAGSLRVEGAGTCLHFVPGYRFHLERHPHADGDYLLTRVEHAVRLPGFRGEAGDGQPYANRFTCIPRDLAYRPPRRTPRTRMAGAQTATVVGPQDQAIWTDRFGRIKVHFHWDRQGQSDGLDSCWVRVATNWAGKGFGLVTLPRVGQEVVVDFLEGDPDQPLVTGSVYNAEQVTPFGLPGNRAVALLKTHSVDGGESDFHGLAFDDRQGKELICLRSQKDLVVSTVRNHTTNVPSNHFVQVGTGQFIVVGGLPLPFTAGNGDGDKVGLDENGQTAESGGETHEGGGEKEGEGDQEADWVKWVGVEMEPFPLAVSIEGTFGVELSMVIGFKTYFDCPAATEVVIDPLGLVGGLAGSYLPSAFARLAAGSAGLTGATDIIYGNKTDLHFGPLVEVRRGPVFVCHDKPIQQEVAAGLVAALHAASVLTTMALPPIIAPFVSAAWAKNATTIAYGIATAMQWLTTQMQIRRSKAAAAVDTAEEALEKAEQALEQLNLDTVSAFQNHVADGLLAVSDLVAAKVEELQESFQANHVSGTHRLSAGEVWLCANQARQGSGRFIVSASDRIGLVTSRGLTAHAGQDVAIRGQNLKLSCAAAGTIRIAPADLPPQQELVYIELGPAGINLVCGTASITLTPGKVQIRGLELDEQTILSKTTAVQTNVK